MRLLDGRFFRGGAKRRFLRPPPSDRGVVFLCPPWWGVVFVFNWQIKNPEIQPRGPLDLAGAVVAAPALFSGCA